MEIWPTVLVEEELLPMLMLCYLPSRRDSVVVQDQIDLLTRGTRGMYIQASQSFRYAIASVRERCGRVSFRFAMQSFHIHVSSPFNPLNQAGTSKQPCRL